MKYLLVLLLAMVVLWNIRRKAEAPAAPHLRQQAEPDPKTVEMYACTQCGLHMPFNDMVIGTHGHYCSAAHRALAEN